MDDFFCCLLKLAGRSLAAQMGLVDMDEWSLRIRVYDRTVELFNDCAWEMNHNGWGVELCEDPEELTARLLAAGWVMTDDGLDWSWQPPPDAPPELVRQGGLAGRLDALFR